jgi:hypothetical protein
MRGPQGSVNGRNATAGAIHIRSAMPDGEFGVSTNLTYGNYDDKEVEAAINIPLIRDMLSMRVSGTAMWRDGYTKNQCAGWNPEALGLPRVDEGSTRAIYEGMDPNPGQWDPVAGEYREVIIDRPRSGPTAGYVYLDMDAVQQVKQNGIAKITTGNNANPVLLGEDLINPDGSPVLLPDGSPAVTGTPVAFQGDRLIREDIDSICTTRSPGAIATFQGAAAENTDWTEGEWLATSFQPSLQEFAGLKRWTNNVENWAARMVLLFEPLDNMEWMLNAHGTQNRGDSAHLQMLGAKAKEDGGFDEFLETGFNEQNASLTAGLSRKGVVDEGIRDVKGITEDGENPGQGGGNPYSGFYSSDGIEYIDAWGINGKGFWDLGVVTISLLYDYEWYDRVVEDEGDANPIKLFPAVWSDSAWQTTEELRIEGEGERYKWAGGFFFLYEELDATNFFPDTRQFELTQKFEQTLTSWAPYLSAEIDLVEQGTIPGIYELKLTAGIRYNNERKEFSLQSSATGTDSGIEAPELPASLEEETWKEWTGDAKLSYTPFSNEIGTLISYLSYGRGFKGGHFNASLAVKAGVAEQDIEPVEPEFIDALEFGIRTRWFDDRLILNAAVFRYWYQALQVFDIANGDGDLPIQKLLNGDADVLGAEAELRIRPLPGLLISGNLGWLDSEFTDFVVEKSIPNPRSGNPERVPFDYGGNRLVAAPEWNWSVITEYEIPLFGWGSLVPQYDFNYRSKAYLDPQMFDPISQDGYWLHNARIAYRTPDERIELAFWVSNLFDEEYKVDVFDVSRSFKTILEVWGEPRMYGVTLSLNW